MIKISIILRQGYRSQAKILVLFLAFLITKNNANSEEIKPENLENLTVAQQLADYKVDNPISKFGVNFALIPIKDKQTLLFDATFKNSQNSIKSKKIFTQITSIGLKTEVAFKAYFIYLLGKGSNFYDMSKEIELGFGIDIRSPLLDITYAPFKEIEGGILILAVPISDILLILDFLSAYSKDFTKKNSSNDLFNMIYQFYREIYETHPLLLALPIVGFGMSVVTGGSITPIELF